MEIIKDQISSLISTEINIKKKKLTTKIIIGLSCLFYLLVSYLFYKDKQYNKAYLILIVYIFSTIADTSDNGSLFHIYDRILSSIIFIYLFYNNKGVNMKILFMIKYIICLYFINRSRKSKTENEWIKNHSLWHIITSLFIIEHYKLLRFYFK